MYFGYFRRYLDEMCKIPNIHRTHRTQLNYGFGLKIGVGIVFVVGRRF